MASGPGHPDDRRHLPAHAGGPPPYLTFEGAIVADTLTAAGPANATARAFTSPAAPLDTFGYFKIKGMPSDDD